MSEALFDDSNILKVFFGWLSSQNQFKHIIIV